MGSTTQSETYGQWLSRQLDERHVSTRALAARLNPDAPDIARRTLRRYLKDQRVPQPAARQQIADALGLTEIEPSDDDADDEADPLGEVLNMLADLHARVADLQARKNNAPAAPLARSTAGASTSGGYTDDGGTDARR